VRVPYANQTVEPTRANGPYRIQIGDIERSVSVSDADVQTGATLRIPRALPNETR
jgi:hypothetical protein